MVESWHCGGCRVTLGRRPLRRRSHDDVHSVEVYHRSIHTLEVINEHPAALAAPGGDTAEVNEGAPTVSHPQKHSYPEPTVRIEPMQPSPTSADRYRPDVPPIAPFELVERVGAITFDDGLVHKSVDADVSGADPAIRR